jgi:Ca2+-binding RTX toxin-like protein
VTSHLFTLSDGATSGTGNNLNNVIKAKNASVLNGLDGNDTLSGSLGHDYLYGGNGKDTLTGFAGGYEIDARPTCGICLP